MEVNLNILDYVCHSNNIKKSKNDPRTYKYIKLDNGLDIILVNDNKTTHSTASLSVGVGSVDENGIHGLAHFLEHMLFLGSKKYPEADIYGSTLAKYNGTSNAFTAQDHTCYYFEVHNEAFNTMLDIFGQFFIEPLFTNTSLMKEMNAVHSEHCNNLLNDSWKRNQVFNTLCKPSHPFNNFGTGCLDTLNIPNIETIVKEFYNKYYSANNMCLTIVSNYDIKHLEAIAKNIFSSVPNKLYKPSRKYELPCETPMTILIAPVKAKGIISIDWQIENVHNYTENKYHIADLVSHIIGHEGYGSIFEYLRTQNLVNTLSVGLTEKLGNVGYFNITIDTTREGFDKKNEIINIIYEYIDMFKNTINSTDQINKDKIKDLYNEKKLLSTQNFINFQKSDGTNFAISTSTHIVTKQANTNFEELLIEDSLYEDYDVNENKIQNLMMALLQNMNKNNAVVIFSNKDYEKTLDRIEPWYKTEFTNNNESSPFIPITDEVKRKLYLPNKNKYICNDLRILRDINNDKHPYLLHDYSDFELWYQFNTKFNVPDVEVRADIIIEDLNDTIKSHLQNILFLLCLKDTVNPDLYECNMSNFSTTVCGLYNGISIIVNGPGAGIYKIVDMITKRLLYPDISLNSFTKQKVYLIEKIRNSILDQPYKKVDEILLQNVATRCYPTIDKLRELENVSYEDIKNFTQLLYNRHIKCLIGGNIEKHNCILIANIFKCFSPVNKVPTFMKNVTTLEKGQELVIKESSTNSKETNSVTAVYVGIDYIKDGITENWNLNKCLLTTVMSMLSDKFFDQLRTQEQLGYCVQAYKAYIGDPNYSYGVAKFVVQSNVKNTEYLKERINKFIKDIREYLLHISNEEFDERIKSMIETLKIKNNNFTELMDQSYNKITIYNGIMNMKEIMINTYENITLDDVIEFYDKYFYNDEMRRQWVVQIESNQ